MSRRSSIGLMPSPIVRPGASRLSVGSRRSIGGMRPPATPSVAGTPAAPDNTASSFLAIQNDEEERRQRQLSRLQQLQSSRQLGSPASEAGSTTDSSRRRSVASLEPRLTGQQLTMHYNKCIQLNAENKINIKNAFNLQLIDYMTEMLRRKDSDMNNFQVASCTLDASTKIYAYRVDCVHTDTVRMAGGLGRTQQEKEAAEGGAGAAGEHAAAGGNLKRRKTKKATIEANPSALTLSSLDLDFMVDPLFKKIASQFDEGRAGGGLFLNSLIVRDDDGHLLLDCEAVLDPKTIEEPLTSDPPNCLPVLSDLPQQDVCPPFTNFHFASWKVGDEDSFCDTSRLDKEEADNDKQLEHAFDPNAVPEPLVDDHMFGDDNADYGGGMDDCDGMDDDTVAATLGEGGNNTCLTVGWGGQHATSGSSMFPPHHQAMETIHLKDHLASMPLEYSYFDSRVMSAWAGPGHWKLKPAARDKSNVKTAAEGGKKRKREDFVLDFRINAEARVTIEKQIEVSKRMTQLSQNTIKLWSEDNCTLPVDLHFDPTDFAKLHGRSEVVVRRLADDTTAVNTTLTLEDEEDQQNNDHHDYDDDHHDTGGDISGGGYDMTLFSQTMLPGSQQRQDGADFLGDNLVQAPNRVAKLNIGYARTAKRMDMKKLKGTVWDMLTQSNQDKENDRNANVDPATHDEKQQMAKNQRYKFSEVYKTLPRRLNSSMAENLSLPLAFIALLHLCNERNLALTAVGDMEDFTISQG